MGDTEVIDKAFAAFAADVQQPPSTTLRGGHALDEYKEPPPFEAAIDDHSDEYLERYPWGIGYLDPASWRHYLPYFIRYALMHRQDGSLVTDFIVSSLRPPDREPPRLGSLNAEQEAAIVEFLNVLAFGEPSPHQALACQTLEEWWIPGALYRPSSNGA